MFFICVFWLISSQIYFIPDFFSAFLHCGSSSIDPHLCCCYGCRDMRKLPEPTSRTVRPISPRWSLVCLLASHACLLFHCFSIARFFTTFFSSPLSSTVSSPSSSSSFFIALDNWAVGPPPSLHLQFWC